VTNIGFDERAVHAKDPEDALANLPALPMEFPLRHPPYMVRDFAADRYDTRHVFGIRSVWSAQTRSFLRFGYQRLPDSIQRVINWLRTQAKAR
jgi:hypothetical protein